MDMTEFHALRHAVNVEATVMDNALGKATERQAVGDHDKAQAWITVAHSALGRVDIALIALDAWAKTQEAPPELPPVPVPPPVNPGPGGSVGTVRKSGVAGPGTGPIRWTAYAGTIYSVTAGDAGSLSWTASSGGVPCEIGRKADLSDAQMGAGASPEVVVAVGDVLYMRFAGGAVSQGCTVSIPR